MKCKICGEAAVLHGSGLILQTYDAQFFRCPRCGFMQTEDPHWLAESYSSAINRSDIGYVGRNFNHSRMVKALIMLAFDDSARFVDFGAGYGMFVRLMRDLGFDFYWQDKYCTNLFAADFCASEPGHQRYELLTAFEVFEHLPDPLSSVEEMLQYSDAIMFSTELVPAPAPPLPSWSYFGLDHGQHVAFYTREALEHIARRFSLSLHSHRGVFHLLTRKSVSPLKWSLALNRYSKFLLNLLIRKQTLLLKDYDQVLGTIRLERRRVAK